MTGDQQPYDSTKKLTQRLDIDFALQAAGLGVWEFDSATKQVNWDEQAQKIVGFRKHPQLIYEQVSSLIYPDDLNRVIVLAQQAMRLQAQRPFDLTVRVRRANDSELRWVRVQGRSHFSEMNQTYRFAGVIQDVTQQTQAQQQIEESEAKLRSFVESAPFPIGIYVGREMRIQLANQSILDIWGKGNNVIGQRYAAILPELENQSIFAQLDSVYTTGESFHATNQRVDLVVQGQVRPYYFNYSFTPLYDTNGHVYGVMNTAADVGVSLTPFMCTGTDSVIGLTQPSDCFEALPEQQPDKQAGHSS